VGLREAPGVLNASCSLGNGQLQCPCWVSWRQLSEAGLEAHGLQVCSQDGLPDFSGVRPQDCRGHSNAQHCQTG
jgi:hypothetical protein